MDIKEAFEILSIEPTNDRAAIKSAYAKILKKYHPEEYPEKFIIFREAYKTALEYGSEEYGSERVYSGEITDKFKNTRNDYDYFEGYEDFKDYFYWENDSKVLEEDFFLSESHEKENENVRIKEWIIELYSLIDKDIRNHEIWKELFKKFYIHYDVDEREKIKHVIMDDKVLHGFTFTPLESHFLSYILGYGTSEEHIEILRILEEDKEIGIEKAIKYYFGIGKLKIGKKNFILYERDEDYGLLYNLTDNIAKRLRKKFEYVHDYMEIFGIVKEESYLTKESRGWLKILLPYFTVYGMLGAIVFLQPFALMTLLTLTFLVTSIIEFFLNKKKGFNWENINPSSTYVFIMSTLCFLRGVLILEDTGAKISVFMWYAVISILLLVREFYNSRLKYNKLMKLMETIISSFYLHENRIYSFI